MSFLDRAIADAVTPTDAGVPVSCSPNAHGPELDRERNLEPMGEPDKTIEQDAAPHISPVRTTSPEALHEPSSDSADEIEPTDETPARPVQSLRRAAETSTDSQPDETLEEQQIRRKLAPGAPSTPNRRLPATPASAQPDALSSPSRRSQHQGYAARNYLDKRGTDDAAAPMAKRVSPSTARKDDRNSGADDRIAPPRAALASVEPLATQRSADESLGDDSVATERGDAHSAESEFIPAGADHGGANDPEAASVDQSLSVQPERRQPAPATRAVSPSGVVIEIGNLEVIVEAPPPPRPKAAVPLPMPTESAGRAVRRL